MTHSSALRWLAVSGVLALSLSACSGDDDPDDTSEGAGAAGVAGAGGSLQGGASGKGGSASGGAAGTSGAAGGTAGKGGMAGGNAGGAGAAGGGKGGASAGAAGSGAGQAGATGGQAGKGGAQGGTAGGAGQSGKGGSAQGGTAGTAGSSGAQGGSAQGGSAQGGTSSAGSGGDAGGNGNAGSGGDGGGGGNGNGGSGGDAGEGGSSGSGNAGGGGDAGAGGSGNAGSGNAGSSGSGNAGFAAEFSSAADLALFTDLYPSLHATLEVSGGRLNMSAVPVSQTGWYADSVAPLLYVDVTGDFVAETDVIVGRRTDVSQPPIGQFNQAGFVVRDPSTVLPGGAHWVMYNVGYQNSSLAREAKTSRPGAPESLSTLYLTDTPGGVHAGRMRVCRVAGTMRFYHRHPGESAFVEEAYDASTQVFGNGSGQASPGVVPGGAIRFDRPDFGPTLQVGLMIGNWAAPYDASASFDYLHIAPASSVADCTKDL